MRKGEFRSRLFRDICCVSEIGIENLCRIAAYFDEDLGYLTGMKDY
ncbi:MAG: hypothetical protein ACLUSP_09430 [Christensenellales bacterium]